MRCTGIIVSALVLMGCHRAAAPEMTAPMAGAEPAEEQLEALIVDDHPTTVAGAYGECPFEPSALPPLSAFDDSKLPQFNAARDRSSNMHRGEGRLDDSQLAERMRPLETEIFRCIDIAACYTSESVGAGELDFEFELGADGKVRAATVRTSDALDVGPVVPCARMALAELKFPAYDGGNMMVSYQLSIE